MHFGVVRQGAYEPDLLCTPKKLLATSGHASSAKAYIEPVSPRFSVSLRVINQTVDPTESSLPEWNMGGGQEKVEDQDADKGRMPL